MNARSLFILGVLNAGFILSSAPFARARQIAERLLEIVTCIIWLRGVSLSLVVNVLHIVAPMRLVPPALALRQLLGMVMFGLVMTLAWPADSLVGTVVLESCRPVGSIVITAALGNMLRNTFGLAHFYQDYKTEIMRVVVMLELYVCVVMAYPYAQAGLHFGMDKLLSIVIENFFAR